MTNRRSKSRAEPRPGQTDPKGKGATWSGSTPRGPAQRRWERFRELLGRPVSGASLAVLRIAVGLVMTLEAWSLIVPNVASISSGESPVETYYIAGQVHFPYLPFSWLPLGPVWFVYGLVGLLALAGVLMAVGLFYRAAAITVFSVWGYFFAVESTRSYWQSHYYLELLVTFLLIWMPAARRFSVDAWRKRDTGMERTIPFWPIMILRGQLVIAYFYAGVAKLNQDWLLDAVPVRWFLGEEGVTRPFARFLSEGQLAAFRGFVESAGFAYFLSYTGLIFDLVIGGLLLVRRTRILGIVLMFIFHATNHFLIFDDIGWFPLVGFLTALIFLDPDWPERFWKWVKQPRWVRPEWRWALPGAVALPGVGLALGWKLKASATETRQPYFITERVALCVAGWLILHAFIPLRHYVIPGDGRFTGEGMSFSWRLKSEVRRAVLHELRIVDEAVVTQPAGGLARISWENWKGERVLYRQVQPGRIDWRLLPEVVVVTEQYIGERVLYNPFAKGFGAEEAMERARAVWKDLHGRAPARVAATLSFPEVLQNASARFRENGKTDEAELFANLAQWSDQLERKLLTPGEASAAREAVGRGLSEHQQTEAVLEAMRLMHPFALLGEGRPRVPFLVMEDPELMEAGEESVRFVKRSEWKNGEATADRYRAGSGTGGGPVMVVYRGDLGRQGAKLLPRYYLTDWQGEAARAPQIAWNSVKHLTASDILHTSQQPFYLRRYARIVADIWEAEHGRRPAVHALTFVSLNGRPYQRLVDPGADLASVPARWLMHNWWIKDLEMERIPRSALRPDYLRE